jgi:hypothetical protein
LNTNDLGNLNVSGLPFSRRLSYLFVTHADGALELHRMTRTYGSDAELRRDRRVNIQAISGAFAVTANPHIMTAVNSDVKLEICFDGSEALRFRGSGAGLLIATTPLSHIDGEYIMDRLDGTIQVTQFMRGELLFAPIVGTLTLKESAIIAAPDDNGNFEFAVHYADEFAEQFTEYKPFETRASESLRDFTEWYSMFANVGAKYEPMKRLAVYMIWISQIAPKGYLKDPAILYSKSTEQACFSWHQVYHAMVMRDPDNAAQTLMNLFGSQDEFGELPDLVDDHNVNITATKPPFHGYGLLYMLERIGDKLTPEHCRQMYGGLAKLFKFWTTLRDTDNDGVPQYNHGCESGHDFSLMFAKGVPVETPDIISYIALLAEGLGKLAERLELTAEAAEWNQKYDYLMNKLTTRFWNGERFHARLSGSHEVVEFDELEAYLPLMLGERLPPEIVERCVTDLTDPELYYTPYGLRSAPKRDGAPGVIMGFSQVKILPGLYKAGRTELAAELLRGYCDWGAEHSPGFLFVEPSANPAPGAANAEFEGFTELSALSGAIWLGCASFLEEIDNGTI